MATIYLNNITKSKASWSIEYGANRVHGDQEGLTFNIATVEFASEYKVCYWTDPVHRHCVNVSDGDAVTYTGNAVICSKGA